MEPIVIDLDTQAWRSRIVRFASLDVVIAIIVVAAQMMLSDDALKTASLISGVVLIVVPFMIPRVFKRRLVIFDEKGITRFVDNRHNLTSSWDQVAYIESSNHLLLIHLKDDEAVTISVANLTHEEYSKIEPRIIEFSRGKGVEVRLI